MSQAVPAWAMHRVRSAIAQGASSRDAIDLAKRTGLTKSLVRCCLSQLSRKPSRTKDVRSMSDPSPAVPASKGERLRRSRPESRGGAPAPTSP